MINLSKTEVEKSNRRKRKKAFQNKKESLEMRNEEGRKNQK